MNRKLSSTGKRNICNEKYGKPKRHLRWRKELMLLCFTIVLLVGIVGGTVAFLVDKTNSIENQFSYSTVSCLVQETMNGNEKSNISIQNTSSTSAYIRAKVVVTWQDNNGNVYGKAPGLDTDYTMSELGTEWVTFEDYYYCTSPVASGENTPQMFASIEQIGKNPAPGYTLCVEILADAIQSSPARAVGEAWGVTISEGSVTEYPAEGGA